MTRLALVVVCAGLLLTGCDVEDDAKAAGKAAGNAAPQKTQNAQEVKTPIVRSLLKALDEAEGGTDEERESVRQTLLDSDEELSNILGDNSRRLIERANKKALAPVICDAHGFAFERFRRGFIRQLRVIFSESGFVHETQKKRQHNRQQTRADKPIPHCNGFLSFCSRNIIP